MIAVAGAGDPTVSQPSARVVFVVTVRNNPVLLDACLRSVVRQDYPKVHCIVVDDLSDDDTPHVARCWQRKHPAIITLKSPPRQHGKMANFVLAMDDTDDHDVIVELDGDDRLLVPDAASDLARLHMRADLVWTQHRVERGPWREWVHWRSTDLPARYRQDCDLPRLPWSRAWYPGHLRSCKAWSFRRLNPDDLKHEGQWVQAAADASYYTPLVEMTPAPLRYFYDRELAVYNITPQNDYLRERRCPDLLHCQTQVASLVASRPAYPTIDHPIWVGLIEPQTRTALLRACAAQLVADPGTRIMLGVDGPPEPSPHSRIQVITTPLRRSPSDRATVGMSESLERVAQIGAAAIGASSQRRPVADLPLIELT